MNVSGFRFVVRLVAAASLFWSCGGLSAVTAASFTSLPLTTGANSRFSDETPEDRQGGWLDLGSNDLRPLSAGKIFASGVPFEILDEAAAGGKSCIVLGGPKRNYLPSAAKVDVEEKQGGFLYLLHGAAWCAPAETKKMAGALFVDYADGTSSEFHVRFGRDVSDWSTPQSFANAARAWTAYNANTQVSLFLSRFKLKNQPVKAIRFEAKDSAWMIVAATLGDEVRLASIRPDLTLDQKYVAPTLAGPLPEMAGLPAPKNVILIIGDGMGPGAIRLTSLYQHKAEGRLVMEQLPVASLCTTYSASSDVTDSAASSTAIATGHKTNNGMLGVNPDKNRVFSFAEVAHREGRAVGIITSDAIVGATPSGFYAHVDSRGAYPDIADFAAGCGYEILIGNANGLGAFLPKGAAEGKRDDSRNVLEEMTTAGYAVIKNHEAFAQVPQNRRVLGFMDKGTLDSERCLAQLTEDAISRLSQNNKGFFLMVECTITDGGGHGNKPELSVRGTLQVDWAVKQAVEFARKNRDTLVLVTADHETGALNAVMSHAAGNRLTLHYNTTSHTGVPVHLYAFGPGASLFSGVIDNTDIAKTIAHLWKLRLPPPERVKHPEKPRLKQGATAPRQAEPVAP